MTCWGCSQDFLKKNGGTWSQEDLCEHPTIPGEKVCPDCHEEIVLSDANGQASA